MKKEIIGIDTGNRCIKTVSKTFITGIQSYNKKPVFETDYIEFDNNYYVLSNQRVAYLQDKTENENYFSLTLFAIKDELIRRKCDLSQRINIELGLGLPPTHLQRLTDSFQKYFERGTVNFWYDNTLFKINIDKVYIFGQGYAAIYADFATIKTFERAYIIDIGGYTTDVIALNNGMIDATIFCESLDMGIIHLYNKISRAINKAYGHSPTENQIDSVIRDNKELSEKEPILDIVQSEVQSYTDFLFHKLVEFGVDLNYATPIFVGGGSNLLHQYIAKSSYINRGYYCTNINANAASGINII